MYTLITTLLSPLLHQFAISCTKTPFLGLIPWYQYLDMTEVNIIDPHTHQTIAGECRIEGFSGDSKLVLGAHSPFLLGWQQWLPWAMLFMAAFCTLLAKVRQIW
jgi:hypothetical protein